MTAQEIKSTFNLKYLPDALTNRESAFRCVDHSVKISFVVLGLDDKFWVVCGADTSRLLKQGFEFAI